MKKQSTILLCLFAFIACMAIGILSGGLKSLGLFITSGGKDSSIPANTPQYHNQRNLVFIQVDSLKNKAPRLETVWLSLFTVDQPELTLLLLYPSQKEQYQNLAGQFKLSSEGRFESTFNTALLSLGFGYQGFIVIDENGFTQWVDWMGGIDNGVVKQDGASLLSQIPKPWDDIGNSLERQKTTAASICEALGSQALETNWSSLLIRLIPDHILTDLSLQEAITTWQQLKGRNEQVTCKILSP
jgi:tetrahydromethanopterin S-methyltransferase subunit B